MADDTEATFEVRLDAALAAMDAIRESNGPWRRGQPGASGTTPCPLCGLTLSYRRSGPNGHTRGRCEAAGCLSWVE